MATNTKKTPTEDAPVLDYSGMNVYRKLQIARNEFLSAGVKKTGKNISLEFKYFELEDIVPTATAIFNEIGLLTVMRFDQNQAVAKVFNCDDPEEDPIVFEAPFTQIAPILSNSGKAVTNEMQALGSSITYMRRYLWQLVLDIIEADEIDAKLGATPDDTHAPAPKPRKAPATTQERKEIKQELTDSDGQASELQITALKTALKKLLETDNEQESFVQSIAVKTESFTKITKDACEQLINGVNEMLAAYEPQEG